MYIFIHTHTGVDTHVQPCTGISGARASRDLEQDHDDTDNLGSVSKVIGTLACRIHGTSAEGVTGLQGDSASFSLVEVGEEVLEEEADQEDGRERLELPVAEEDQMRQMTMVDGEEMPRKECKQPETCEQEWEKEVHEGEDAQNGHGAGALGEKESLGEQEKGKEEEPAEQQAKGGVQGEEETSSAVKEEVVEEDEIPNILMHMSSRQGGSSPGEHPSAVNSSGRTHADEEPSLDTSALSSVGAGGESEGLENGGGRGVSSGQGTDPVRERRSPRHGRSVQEAISDAWTPRACTARASARVQASVCVQEEVASKVPQSRTHSKIIRSSLSLKARAADTTSIKSGPSCARAGAVASTDNGHKMTTAAGAIANGGRERGAEQEDMRQLFWRSAAAKRWAGKAKLDVEQPGTRVANVVATGTRQMQEPLTARSDSADDALLGQGETSGGLAAAHIPTARNDEVPGDDERGARSVPSVPSTPKTLAGLEILDLSEIEAHQTGKKPHANQDVTVSPSSSSPVSASSRASSRPASPPPPSHEPIPALPNLALSFKIMDLDSTFVFEERFDAPRRGAALYDFPAAEEDELRLTRGQQIYLVGKAEEEWYIGINLSGEAGLVPANYISSIDPPRDLPQETGVAAELREASEPQDEDGVNAVLLLVQSSPDGGGDSGESEEKLAKAGAASLGKQGDADGEDEEGSSTSISSVSFKSSDLLDSLNAWEEADAHKQAGKPHSTAAPGGGGGGGGDQRLLGVGGRTAPAGQNFLLELEEGMSD